MDLWLNKKSLILVKLFLFSHCEYSSFPQVFYVDLNGILRNASLFDVAH
ncbi:Uncharacterised protein [Sphingobacterium thalpophilum]|uniref:Uncharacterized protein n=1 Tax=Sphingobacterium thalpophilum TaxID=259 RepID=A0A4U9UC67_9SPHI|nr:Uncharacterised protein [Sphingobacterium thalpophilum]